MTHLRYEDPVIGFWVTPVVRREGVGPALALEALSSPVAAASRPVEDLLKSW